MSFKVTAVHGEGRSIFHVVNTRAPEAEQPAIVASFNTRPEAIADARARREALRPVKPGPFNVGDRVRPSAYVVERKRQEAIKWLRGSHQRSVLDDAHARELNRRGTIEADLTKDPRSPMPMYAYRVRWDDGSISDLLCSRIDPADREIRNG